jgi:SpoVK/Ycf46/Vps4 family AAA+-type ATPase
MLYVVTTALATMLLAATSAEPEARAVSPRLTQLAQRCQVQRGISADAFRKFLRDTKRQRAGWTVVVSGSSTEGRERQAKRIGLAAGVDVYRITLDEVVGKYIGETEKNLARLMETPTKANVVLFFDEADALFGKRTAVKDAHDKYANQEISYLIQRLEAYADLVIVGVSSPVETLRPATHRWADTVVAARPEDEDAPLPWHRLCWPPRAAETGR